MATEHPAVAQNLNHRVCPVVSQKTVTGGDEGGGLAANEPLFKALEFEVALLCDTGAHALEKKLCHFSLDC